MLNCTIGTRGVIPNSINSGTFSLVLDYVPNLIFDFTWWLSFQNYVKEFELRPVLIRPNCSRCIWLIYTAGPRINIKVAARQYEATFISFHQPVDSPEAKYILPPAFEAKYSAGTKATLQSKEEKQQRNIFDWTVYSFAGWKAPLWNHSVPAPPTTILWGVTSRKICYLEDTQLLLVLVGYPTPRWLDYFPLHCGWN